MRMVLEIEGGMMELPRVVLESAVGLVRGRRLSVKALVGVVVQLNPRV